MALFLCIHGSIVEFMHTYLIKSSLESYEIHCIYYTFLQMTELKIREAK
jgi:hypothetical protein